MGEYDVENASSRSSLQRNAVQGGMSLAGGIALLALHGLAGIPFLGIIAGIAMAGFGYTMVNKKYTRKAGELTQGGVLLAAGIITAVAALPIPVISGFGAFVLWGSGIGLVGYGIWKLFQYHRGMRNRG